MAAPKAPMLDSSGKKSKDVSLGEDVFGAEVKAHLVHEAVRSEMNAQRAGTSATKSRGLVSGGRAKPWRQKGTGRARQGTIRAPQFSGGGHAFAKTPRDFVQKVNRKAAKAALRSALAESRQRGIARRRLRDDFDAPSTKQGKALVEAWGQRTPLVIVATEGETNLLEELPQPAARRRHRAERARGRGRSSGRVRCSSPRRRCRSSRGGRSNEPAREPGPAGADRQREELRRVDGRPVHVQGAPGRAQDADPPGRRADVRRQGRARQRDQGAGEAEAAWRDQGHAPGLEEGHRAAARRRHDRDLRRSADSSHASP